MPYYPLFLDLTDRPALLVGGGTVGEQKAAGLLEAGARLTLISPDATPGLAALADGGRISWHRREYQPGDLADAFLVIAATDRPEVNARIREEAEARHVLLNSVDDPPNCNFIVPAIVRRGDLTIAISTAGNSPALAARIRARLEAEFGDVWARLVRVFGELRPEVIARYHTFDEKKAVWYRIVDDVLARITDEWPATDDDLRAHVRTIIESDARP